MIAQLRGILIERNADSCVLDCGGVGYQVICGPATLAALPALGGEVTLSTWLHVREDGQSLFGFEDPREKQLFLLLLTVKGVGPKVAMSMLGTVPPAQLAGALQRRDLPALTRLPGVGKKLAERLAVEISDKAKELGWADGAGRGEPGYRTSVGGSQAELAATALTRLGYTPQASKIATEKAYQSLGDTNASLEDIVREALKLI